MRNNAAGGEDQEPSSRVVTNVCMHLGCPVVGTATGFGCPCHGGQYDPEGRRTAGPPARPLNRFEYTIEDGNLFIGRALRRRRSSGTARSS